MKQKPFSHNEKRAGASPALNGNSNQNENEFTPDSDEVARKAYFAYVNEGSPQGRDVQHWLDAEAELIEERNQTRTHTFHHQA